MTVDPGIVAAGTLGVALTGAAYLTAVLDGAIASLVGGQSIFRRSIVLGPVRRAAFAVLQRRPTTEHPDAGAWTLAPALLGALAATAAVAVPIPGLGIADVPSGLVLFGAATALVTIAVFLHGWSSNSLFPLFGAYRFIALALSVEIPFFLVLIAAALPAESLSVHAIVTAQRDGWILWRQPLGLPIYLASGLGVAFWGPFALSDGPDLAGGTRAEVGGVPRLVWRAAQHALLVAIAGMGAAAFLGGGLGPIAPAWAWFALKTGVLLTLMLAAGHLLPVVPMVRLVRLGWLVLLPAALVDVFLSGILLL